MAYVDFTYYSTSFGGTTIPEADFLKLERQARTFLNNITFNRLTGESAIITNEVKDCICEMMECKYNLDNSENTIASETVDSHSVTYAVDKNAIEETEQQKLYRIAKLYLSNTNLLYRGV